MTDLGNVEKANKDYPTAERDFREALHIAKITDYEEGVGAYTGFLASLAIPHEQWAEAETLTAEDLALAEKGGRDHFIASNSHRLAIALLKQNSDLEEALSLARRAIEISTCLHHRDLPAVQKPLAVIKEKLKE